MKTDKDSEVTPILCEGWCHCGHYFKTTTNKEFVKCPECEHYVNMVPVKPLLERHLEISKRIVEEGQQNERELRATLANLLKIVAHHGNRIDKLEIEAIQKTPHPLARHKCECGGTFLLAGEMPFESCSRCGRTRQLEKGNDK